MALALHTVGASSTADESLSGNVSQIILGKKMRTRIVSTSLIMFLAACAGSPQEHRSSVAEVDSAQSAYLECAIENASRMARVSEPANIISQFAIMQCTQERMDYHMALRKRLNGAPNVEGMITDLDEHILQTITSVVVNWRAEALRSHDSASTQLGLEPVRE